MQAFFTTIKKKNKSFVVFPKKELVHSFFDELYVFLFANTSNSGKSEELIEHSFYHLKNNFYEIVFNSSHSRTDSTQQTDLFFDAIPSIYDMAIKDAKTIFEKDPAANSLEEILYAYPGFFAIAVYRFAHQLWNQKLELFARILSEYAHSKTGIEIHPAAKIGKHFAIDHGTGIVIGQTCIIGNDVQIYQGVTLGALSVKKEEAQVKRHPTIEDNVIIYANGTILGGNTVIGKDSIIGGNVWITNSVPRNSVVYHKNEIKIKDNIPFEEPINYVI